MVDYRRMVNTEQHLENATSTISHQLRDVWKNPRATVIRIEALALVAILLSFILAAFGSCRRWSNRWIIQKGFLAANALSLSLGTYSIGLMQSTPVKSEMYPIWAVSLLTLFGSVDSITSYNGLDYRSALFKALFQLCLYCGYVLLISVSGASSNIGKIAIIVLSVITFIKGFHRSLAHVLPSRQRNILRMGFPGAQKFFRGYFDYTEEGNFHMVHLPIDDVDPNTEVPQVLVSGRDGVVRDLITISDIGAYKDAELEQDLTACKGACLSVSLSHLLQRRFVGLKQEEKISRYGHSIKSDSEDDDSGFKWLMEEKNGVTGFEWAFRLIEVELAFLYDVFFSSNAFLHYYQAKAATLWTFASVMGICFVGAVAVRPGTRISTSSPSSSSPGSDSSSNVVESTTADVAITLVVLVSLALLQVLQALRCWTSNWARVSFSCDFVRKYRRHFESYAPGLWLRLRALLTRLRWFDSQLWQNKLGQYSVIESTSTRRDCMDALFGPRDASHWTRFVSLVLRTLLRQTDHLRRTLGIQYIQQVFWELWGGAATGVAVDLGAVAVKTSIAHVLGEIEHAGPYLSPLVSAQGLELLVSSSDKEEGLGGKQWHDPELILKGTYDPMYMWAFHIATCYCELAQRKSGGIMEEHTDRNHGVATALSKYCAYLSVSAPHLLPGDVKRAKFIFAEVMGDARTALRGANDKFEAMQKWKPGMEKPKPGTKHKMWLQCFSAGVTLGKCLLEKKTPDERWSLMADFWVRELLAAAPSDNVEDHIRHLSLGGEFITHLWAFLYHAGIDKWQLPSSQPQS